MECTEESIVTPPFPSTTDGTDTANIQETTMEGAENLKYGVQESAVQSLIEDVTKHLPGLDDQNKFQLLLHRVYNHEVTADEIGLQPEIKQTSQPKCLNPNATASKIVIPKEEKEIKERTNFCLSFIRDMKEKGYPSGITLNQLRVKPDKGRYREGEEYVKVDQVLGKGNMAGPVIVVKDKATGSKNAMKTVMISDFREDEVRCWIDLSDTGLSPQLYMFHYDQADNKIKFHMEPLQKAKTLREVIDEHMYSLWESNPDIVRPFSLCVLHDIFGAIETMNKKDWTHGDLNAGNLMLNHQMKLKVLDFGKARPFKEDIKRTKGLDQNFHSDIMEAIRKFTALYLGQEFESQHDMKSNWKDLLASDPRLDQNSKEELFNLLDCALQIEVPTDILKVKDNIQGLLQEIKKEEIMKEVAKVLFPKEYIEQGSMVDSPMGDAMPVDFLTQIRLRISIGSTY